MSSEDERNPFSVYSGICTVIWGLREKQSTGGTECRNGERGRERARAVRRNRAVEMGKPLLQSGAL